MSGLTHARGLVLAIVVSLCSLGAGGLFGASVALAESCPNEASRQGPSVSLPQCRVYEQVTPVDKGDAVDLFGSSGFFPNNFSHAYVAEDGDAILLDTDASFPPEPATPSAEPSTLSAAYVFSRGVDGWGMSTVEAPVDEPQLVEDEVFDPADLSKLGFHSDSGTDSDLAAGAASSFQITNLLGPPGGPYAELHRLSGFAALSEEEELKMVGGSEDLSKVVLESKGHSLASEAEGQDPGSSALYESAGGGECGSMGSSCKLVNLNSEGKLLSSCGAQLGQANTHYGGAHSAVSSDGSKIFFTAPMPEDNYEGFNIEGEPGCWVPGKENPPQLYMREDGARTVEISAPEQGVKVGTPENPTLPAVFVGASSDGSKVFFMTRTELTKNAVGHTPELYEYETESGKLTLISGGEAGTSEGDVDFVGAVSSDGSAVYFSAFGKLAPEAAALTRAGTSFLSPVNLYRYDTLTGVTTYITAVNVDDYPLPTTGYLGSWYTKEFEEGLGEEGLGSGGAELEGLAYDKEWYTTGNGEYLVFGTIRSLTGFDNTEAPGQPRKCQSNYPEKSFEPEQCLELYRYDAQAAEHKEPSIVCVSCAGGAPVDEALFARTTLQSPAGGPPRPISENGQDVFFDTASALVPQAVPGKVHVYEWHDGAISMISPPNDTGNAFFLGSGAEGTDVFFTTHAQLAPSDTDESADVYDARVDGGFQGLAPLQCTGTGCQGVPGAPPIFATPASVTFAGVGNFPASQAATKPAPKPKPKPKKCRGDGSRRGEKHGRCAKVKKRAKKSAKGRR
jgi:hypothetical protein